MNGVYVAASGLWGRDEDMDEDNEISNGVFIFVEKGNQYANTGWVVTTKDPITIAEDNIGAHTGKADKDVVFSQFSSAGYITAGTGL